MARRTESWRETGVATEAPPGQRRFLAGAAGLYPARGAGLLRNICILANPSVEVKGFAQACREFMDLRMRGVYS